MDKKEKNAPVVWVVEDLVEMRGTHRAAATPKRNYLAYFVMALLIGGMVCMAISSDYDCDDVAQRDVFAMHLRKIARQKGLEATAVLLSYHRKSNMRAIVDVLFASGIFDDVIVWNNDVGSPIPEEYVRSPDERRMRVRVVEAEENLGTYNRYVACTMANTSVCYFQDDDWNTEGYIQNLYAAFLDNPSFVHAASNVFGLIYTTPNMAVIDEELGLKSSLSWIGCGAFALKSDAERHAELAREFLTPDIAPFQRGSEEWEHISHPDQPIFHADLAFTLFKNQIPVVFGQNIRNLDDVSEPISDGGAATRYLVALYDRIAERMKDSLQSASSPFVNEDGIFVAGSAPVTLCEDRPCGFLVQTQSGVTAVNGTHFQFANAVDGNHSTLFIAPGTLKQGDFYGVDWFIPRQTTTVHFQHPQELQASLRVELSDDGETWRAAPSALEATCQPHVCKYTLKQRYRAIRFVQSTPPRFTTAFQIQEIE